MCIKLLFLIILIMLHISLCCVLETEVVAFGRCKFLPRREMEIVLAHILEHIVAYFAEEAVCGTG